MLEVCVCVSLCVLCHTCVHAHVPPRGPGLCPSLSPIGIEGGVMDGWRPPSELGVLTML